MTEQTALVDQGKTDPQTSNAEKATAAVGRSRSRTVYFLIIGCALPLGVLPCIPIIGIAVDVHNSNRERHRLLHETDHRALLEASRTLMREHPGEHIADPANDPRVPQIIRELGPSYMDISTQQLRVELHGGFDHYGFVAYPAGANAGDGWGKLIDGLFYYTE